MTSILDPTALADLRERALDSVTGGHVPSCQIAVGYGGDVVYEETFGAEEGSRYVIFSATKPVVTSVIWMLLSEGRLELERPIAADIPEFATNGKDVVTLEQVLLHTGGFPHAPMRPELWNDRAARLRRFADWRLTLRPGEQFEYHATAGHWVLAELIERATGRGFPCRGTRARARAAGAEALRARRGARRRRRRAADRQLRGAYPIPTSSNASSASASFRER